MQTAVIGGEGMKTYLVEYHILHMNGDCAPHTTRVKNCEDQEHAIEKLTDYVDRKYPDNLTIEIDDIRCETMNPDPIDAFNRLFGFNNNNPFNF